MQGREYISNVTHHVNLVCSGPLKNQQVDVLDALSDPDNFTNTMLSIMQLVAIAAPVRASPRTPFHPSIVSPTAACGLEQQSLAMCCVRAWFTCRRVITDFAMVARRSLMLHEVRVCMPQVHQHHVAADLLGRADNIAPHIRAHPSAHARCRSAARLLTPTTHAMS